MNIDVNGVSITLTDEQLKHIDEELKKKNNEVSWAEEFFLSMWNGCEIKFYFEKANSVFMLKNGEVIFEQDFKNERLWCKYSTIWSVFESKYSMDYIQIQSFIKGILEKRFKLGGLTPSGRCCTWLFSLEKRFKLGGLTPLKKEYFLLNTLEKRFKLGD